MPTNEQKELWRKEKEQMLRDKQNQPKEVRRRAVAIQFGGVKKTATKKLPPKPNPTIENIPDNILRKRLGI